MKRTFKAHRSKLALIAALGALAILALPAIAYAKPRDRNHDGIPDRWEKRYHLSLTVNQAHRNQDHEGLNDLQEFLAETNPRDPDTDNNGITDGEENAGRIESFEGGVLVVNLFNGSSVSGAVNEETEIECGQRQSGASASDLPDGEEADSPDGEETSEDGGSDQEEAGEDSGEQESGSENGNCTVADLERAAEEHAVVKEAELSLENGGGVFEKIELAG